MLLIYTCFLFKNIHQKIKCALKGKSLNGATQEIYFIFFT